MSQEGWTVEAVGDFDSDGMDDLLRKYKPTGRLAVCFMQGLMARECRDLIPGGLELSGAVKWEVVGPR